MIVWCFYVLKYNKIANYRPQLNNFELQISDQWYDPYKYRLIDYALEVCKYS